MTGASMCDRLLEACAKLGEAELAALAVQSMHALGVPVGYVAHSCLLRALCVAGYHEVRPNRQMLSSIRRSMRSWLFICTGHRCVSQTTRAVSNQQSMPIPDTRCLQCPEP